MLYDDDADKILHKLHTHTHSRHRQTYLYAKNEKKNIHRPNQFALLIQENNLVFNYCVYREHAASFHLETLKKITPTSVGTSVETSVSLLCEVTRKKIGK